MLDESKRNIFLFFPEKFISLFAPSVSTVARVVASGKTIIYLSPTFSTVNGPYQISGQCLEGERNFFLFFLLSKHFYLDETNKLWLFFYHFMAAHYFRLFWQLAICIEYLRHSKKENILWLLLLLISASFCFHTFSKRNISKLLYIKPIIIWLSSKSYLRKQNYFRIS